VNLREVRIYDQPPPGRWVIRTEIPRSDGRFFEVNVPQDITMGELEGLFVEAQEAIAYRQAENEKKREAATAATEPAGPPPLDDQGDGSNH
jgi:hypothetical protein